nr:MAG TPA: hypothetical protein [Caudoviricetes sp.]
MLFCASLKLNNFSRRGFTTIDKAPIIQVR